MHRTLGRVHEVDRGIGVDVLAAPVDSDVSVHFGSECIGIDGSAALVDVLDLVQKRTVAVKQEEGLFGSRARYLRMPGEPVEERARSALWSPDDVCIGPDHVSFI